MLSPQLNNYIQNPHSSHIFDIEALQEVKFY